ncbi:MAG: MoaD family protein [Pseudomonadota bacterium]
MNKIFVRLPASLRHLTGNNILVESTGNSIDECIDELEVRFTGLKNVLCDADGNISDLLLVFINGRNVRNLQGIKTALEDGDQLNIIPFASGG